MKITNYKEQEEAEAYLLRLEQRREELENELYPIQIDINKIEQALEDYAEEQRAMDE